MAKKIFKYCILLLVYFFVISESKMNDSDNLPVVINTWAFLNATEKAWDALSSGTVIDAVEAGCSICEYLQCDGTVGYGGSPDENGETTLDAMIMDGSDLNIGAVAGLRRIKKASSVARHVLENTRHSLLVGDLATQFAIKMGFHEESLETSKSHDMWEDWTKASCQPNFWTNVKPDPMKSCGPYRFNPKESISENDVNYFNGNNHDTIGLIAIDSNKHIAAGTSTNGAKYKIPGRVGDSPIPGAGAYADDEVGAAVATGDGDVMMRLLPSYLAVEEMRKGESPTHAAEVAMKRIIKKYPVFFGAVIAVNADGDYGASCHGMDQFPFGVRNLKLGKVTLQTVSCLSTVA